MKIMKSITFSTFTAAILALGACASDSVQVTSMSCTDLAREIGRATQTRDDANVDSILGTVEMLAADNKDDEISSGVESLVGDISGSVAQSELDTLNRAFVQKGCR